MIRAPSATSDRAITLLRGIGHCGPLFFSQIERGLPAFAPDLRARRTASRLLYRELATLAGQGLLASRRPAGSRAAAYAVTERGAALLEAHGHALSDPRGAERYFAAPRHESILRGLLVELVLARAIPGSPLGEVAWSLTERYPTARDPEGRTGYQPDAVLWLTTTTGTAVTVLVEVDRGTETLGRWGEKVNKAAGAIAGLGGAGRFLILTEGERRLISLLEVTRARVAAANLSRIRGALADEVCAERLFAPCFRAVAAAGAAPRVVTLADWQVRS